MIFADLCNYWRWGVVQIDVVKRVDATDTVCTLRQRVDG